MSPSALAYLAGMAALFVGQRLLSGIDSAQWFVTAAGVVVIVLAAVLRFRGLRGATDEGQRFGHRVALTCLLIGIAALVMYVATTESVVRSLTLDAEGEDRWLGVWRSLWPVVWLLGTIPMLVVDWAIVSSPVMMPVRRIRDLSGHGIVAALGIALVFPINFIAAKRQERWDLAYFKTAQPGTATLAIVESLELPVHVRIFMPPSSDVAQELQAYFAQLEGPMVSVEVIDQAAEPRLAKALSVRDNGVVTITQGEVDLEDVALDEPDAKADAPDDEGDAKTPKPITRTLKVATDLEKAKRTLKKLDGEVQTILRELGHGERVAYFTTGHGELGWDGGSQAPADRQIVSLKSRLKQLGFKVKTLSIQNGLAEKVPDDADLVAIMGPMTQFQQAEVDALRVHVDSGGSLLVALEPAIGREQLVGTDPLDGLLAHLGVELGAGVLASEQGIVPLAHNKRDRFNLVTDSFTQHPSTTTLSERSEKNVLFAPAAGYLEEVDEHASKITFTVRTLAVVWADLEPVDAEYAPDAGESKSARNLVAAIEGGSDAAAWRAIVTSDSSIFSDLGIGNLGNQRFTDDGLNWLIGAEALSGTTETEEDVKIEHTKEGQTSWFYLTVLGIPLAVLVLGGLRMRLRRRGGAR
jgi:hypothetical protein